ncbi:MAG TPA: 3-dehydroquinate synthase [Candidatus Saccharimonadales bacterium]
MKNITVTLPTPKAADYSIYVGAGALQKIGELYDLGSYSKLFVIADEGVQPLLEKLLAVLPGDTVSLILPAGEQAKHIQTVEKIWTALHAAGCDRKSLVINLGGGVVGDLGGFAASTYMRGLDFLNVPTTLLSQVDASVGGKTGFNFDGVKNLIGTFSHPVSVVIDPSVLKALPERQFLSGFAEIIKHGLIWDKEHLEEATRKLPQQFSQDELTAIIVRSCQIKVEILTSDVTERGPRKLVNFGHTIGHAIEVLSLDTNRPLTHGEAIAIGMVVEADISRRLSLLTPSEVNQIKETFSKIGLLVPLPSLPISDVIEKTRSDKKNEGGKVNYTLLKAIGQALYDQQVDESVVRAALEAEMGAS